MPPEGRNDLEEYLFAPENSRSKESLINNKLLFDLKLAAAERGYFLNAYTPEVDQLGFDIIFDDQERLAKIQLKTVMKGTPTRSWAIHKSLLRPTPNLCEELGFEPSPTGTGYGGGILLMEVAAKEQFTIRYFYSDIIVICAMRDGILNLCRPPSKKKVDKLFHDVNEGLSHDKVRVDKSLFLEATNPNAVLTLIGLHSTLGDSTWRYHIQKMVQPLHIEGPAAPYDQLKDFVSEELSNLCPQVVGPPQDAETK